MTQHSTAVQQHGHGSISYFRISIFDPVSQAVQMEGSYDLLNYKDWKQLAYMSMKTCCC